MSQQVDFIFQSDARRIFDTFARLFDIRIVFFSFDGKELTSGANRPRCRYCRLLRQKLMYEFTCKHLDRKNMLQASQHKRLITYTCHGGMIEASLPVYMVDKLLGYIMIGQFRTSAGMPTKLRRVWQIMFDTDELYEAFQQTPCFDKKRVKEILSLFSLLVDQIVSRHLITTNSNSSIHTLISYIDEHPEINVSLADAAAMLDRSISSVSHDFRKATGKAFKEYVIARKLAKADELLARNTMKIHEIATAVGYIDPYFFSRIYKKHRGRAPSLNADSSQN